MSKKKNIVFILPDQLRADFCGCYGADWLKTPNIDCLANEGIKYTGAITPSPACVPARASLLTGKSPIANRVLDNMSWLRPDHEQMGVYTWPEKLAQLGYSTAAIGKMHFYPWDITEGFTHRVIAEDKRHVEIEDDYTMFLKQNGYKRLHGSASEGYYEYLGATVSYLPEKYQIDRFVCDEALKYINTLDDDKPFAMMVGFPGPHCPYDPSKEMIDKMSDAKMPKAAPRTKDSDTFLEQNISDNLCPWNGVDLHNFTDEKKERVRKHYSALVQAIDEYVGEIINKLKEKNLYEDTLIILSSDHGDYLGDFGMAGKGHFYESAIRIPMIVKHPEYKGLVYNHTVSLGDINNTILDFAGVEVKDTNNSTVLAPFRDTVNRSSVLGANERGWMLRNNQYIYTVYFNNTRELYDYHNDPNNQHNLVGDEKYKDVEIQMRNELENRVFAEINEGNEDNIAKPNNLYRKGGMDRFNFEGWKRPYPFCKK